MKLIDRWLACGPHRSSMLQQRRGIAQGFILSPLFCNLYLHKFDTALAKANIPFVRYADDFLLFTSSKTDAESALEFAGQRLAKLGLQLHPQKTHIVRASPVINFLGQSLPSPSR